MTQHDKWRIDMASIRKEFVTSASPAEVWSAIRDVGALHTRLVPGFVVDTRLEPGARIVTFANGITVREIIVTIDDEAMRLVWSAKSERLTHHNGAVQVFPDAGNHAKVVWSADLLPNEMAEPIGLMMDQGVVAMKKALDGLAAKGETSSRGAVK